MLKYKRTVVKFSASAILGSKRRSDYLDEQLLRKVGRSAEKMVKHRLRDSMKSLFRSHIDPEKEEQLKGAKRGTISIKIIESYNHDI